MSDDKRQIIFHVESADVTANALDPQSHIVSLALSGETKGYELFEGILKRIDESGGLKLSDVPSLVDEAVTTLKNDLEQEKLRHADAERVLQDRITQLEADVSHANRRAEIAMSENQRLVPENIRLRGLEKTLEELAGLAVQKGGNIGP